MANLTQKRLVQQITYLLDKLTNVIFKMCIFLLFSRYGHQSGFTNEKCFMSIFGCNWIYRNSRTIKLEKTSRENLSFSHAQVKETVRHTGQVGSSEITVSPSLKWNYANNKAGITFHVRNCGNELSSLFQFSQVHIKFNSWFYYSLASK